MDLIRYIVLFFLFSLHSSCTYTENVHFAQTIGVTFDRGADVHVVAGSVDIIDSTDHRYVADIRFDEVRGGQTLLFGRFVIRDIDGHKIKRLHIVEDGNERRYSVNELVEMSESGQRVRL